MKLVIDIPEKIYKHIIFQKLPCQQLPYGLSDMIKNGTPLPKGHGRLVDISKIDEDRIESDNHMIHITINGEYTEAISLDYLNELSTIIEYDIPDNATNGDMVKAMFPYSQYGTNGDEVHVFRVGGNGVLVFSLNWWNAPYKAESEDKGCR